MKCNYTTQSLYCSVCTADEHSRHILFGVVDKRTMLLIRDDDDDNDIASLIMTILFISLFSCLPLPALLRVRFARHKTNETVIIIVMVIVGG